MSDLNIEGIAKLFHDRYEYLAPNYGWKTQEQSAVPWDELPENQKDLMVHVVANLIDDPRFRDFCLSKWMEQVGYVDLNKDVSVNDLSGKLLPRESDWFMHINQHKRMPRCKPVYTLKEES